MGIRQRNQENLIAWRRAEILRLLSQGCSQAECARRLQLDESVVSLDYKWLRDQAKETIRKFLDERLPEEVQRAFVCYDLILQEAWQISSSSVADKRTKLNALSLAKDTLAAKLDLASNVDVVSHVLDLAKKKEQGQELHHQEQDVKMEHQQVQPEEQDEDPQNRDIEEEQTTEE
jgi:hypothetical protein